MSNGKMIKHLQLLRPTAAQNDIKESVQIAQGDLRKAQTHIEFYSDLAGKGAHVYFGTRDVLCRGIQKPLDYNEQIWVSANQCQVMTSCEQNIRAK